jgi:hypothetical protein
VSEMKDTKGVEDRFVLSEDQLLAQLGAELVGPQALPLKPNELAERARRRAADTAEYAGRLSILLPASRPNTAARWPRTPATQSREHAQPR